MTAETAPSGAPSRAADLEEWVRIEASISAARWVGVGFALFQITAFGAPGIPSHVRPVGYALAAMLALANLVAGHVRRRVRTVDAARRLAWATLLSDAALISGFVWLYAFDPSSSLYLLFFVLPAQAALKFQATGALVAWAACTATYVAREVWASGRYGAELDVTSITFRMGVLLIVSLLVGMFARKLAERGEELEQALAELERQAEWRQALIDMLAHDLRSPVGTATSTVMLIRDRIDRLSTDEIRRLATVAVAQNERALMLTQDLLDLARAKQGRLEMQREEVLVGPLVSRVLATVPLEPTDVTVAIEDGLRALIDPARLEQVVANLLTNAAKHGAPPVLVSAGAVEGDTLEIRITDHGTGIPAAVQPSLFASFARGSAAGSVGLGLWVVRTLVDAHGGTVTYDPEGTRPSFRVRIPGAARPMTSRPGDAVERV